MNRVDLWVGLFTAALAAIVLFFVVPAGIHNRMVSGMSVAFFPKMLLVLIIVFSLLLVARCIYQARSAPPEPGLENISLDLILLATLPISYLVIRYLGISAFALLGTPPVMITYGERRWWLIGITAVAIAVCARVVTVYLLQRPPLGIW